MKKLNEKEALVWYLGHSGWAVKTKNNLLIFDYTPPRNSPDIQSLARGIINPEELTDLNVYVFVTHAHSDHYYPGILEWEKTVKNIKYIFGWQVMEDPAHYYMKGPGAELNIDGIEISTVNANHNMIPEVAYLVKVDGIVIYHSGDYMGPDALFKEDMDLFSKKNGYVDLAFVFLGGGQTFEAIKAMKPVFTFPMHAFDREYMYRGFARTAQKLNLPTNVICADKRGDRYFYSNNKLK